MVSQMEKEKFIKFLEKKPLYTRLRVEPKKIEIVADIPNVNINLYCDLCRDNRTFQLREKAIFYNDGNYFVSIIDENTSPVSSNDRIFFRYTCASCHNFDQDFLIRISDSMDYLQKIGQYPEWSIRIDKTLKEILGKYAENYETGSKLESLGKGIGAFAYYRRIIEVKIDELLNLIPELMPDEEKEKLMGALEETKKSKYAQEKIQLIKDLLPISLRPGGLNPLDILYEALSVGIHTEDDKKCLESAEKIRIGLNFLIKRLIEYNQDTLEFTNAMKHFLEKKQKHLEKKKS